MASTPASIPPAKSPVLNFGAIAVVMMTFESASVRAPSSP
jgi:hypothetical protein